MNYYGFKKIWLVDFEFHQPDGELPLPLCVAAYDFVSKRWESHWLEGERTPPKLRYSLGPDDLLVAYYSSAELNCHLALKWDLPINVLDLYAEFRCRVSGLNWKQWGLLDALSYFGCRGQSQSEKESMRMLAIKGPPYSHVEQNDLLEYCKTDIEALKQLLTHLWPGDRKAMKRALLRGRYMKAAAQIETNGIPIDDVAYKRFANEKESIRDRLIKKVDATYGAYERGTFKIERWHRWCQEKGIDWPLLKSGNLDLNRDTFKFMAKRHSAVEDMYNLRQTLSELRNNKFCIGADSRNRCILSAFGSTTGRNQPSVSRFVFGQSKWFRHFIRPQEGKALAYVDYGQQEFAIAAALSGDGRMKDAYRSGDPYLAFAKQAGAVPDRATKESHPHQRELYKECALGVQYGMTAKGLAKRLGKLEIQANYLIQAHKKLYHVYWEWSERVEDTFTWTLTLQSAFGWQMHFNPSNFNPRAARNFPMQANGAEILRIACVMLTENEIRVCAPVHDAFLIEADEGRIDETVRKARKLMEEASKVVLEGFGVRTDYKIIRYPDLFSDPKGVKMWTTITDLLTESEGT